MKIRGQSVPDRKNSKYEGPEAGRTGRIRDKTGMWLDWKSEGESELLRSHGIKAVPALRGPLTSGETDLAPGAW